MRKLLFIIPLFLMASCNSNNRQQQKAESLVKLYLDSLNGNSNNYQILGYKNFQAIYTSADEDPNFKRYRFNPAKIDSIEKNFSPKVRGWIIYVVFKGKGKYGTLGEREFQFAINKDLSKRVAAIEMSNNTNQ
jgi:hypothetical protein